MRLVKGKTRYALPKDFGMLARATAVVGRIRYPLCNVGPYVFSRERVAGVPSACRVVHEVNARRHYIEVRPVPARGGKLEVAYLPAREVKLA